MTWVAVVVPLSVAAYMVVAGTVAAALDWVLNEGKTGYGRTDTLGFGLVWPVVGPWFLGVELFKWRHRRKAACRLPAAVVRSGEGLYETVMGKPDDG